MSRAVHNALLIVEDSGNLSDFEDGIAAFNVYDRKNRSFLPHIDYLNLFVEYEFVR